MLLSGGAGVAYGAFVYLTLPDVTVLARRNPPVTAFMALKDQAYRQDGRTPPRRHHTWVPLRAVSPHLVNAVLMAEDTAFYQHDGVDYHELWESLKIGWREKRLTRGASTITQQLAKNLYLSPERSATRKLRELLIARRLETALDKRRILELYLNVAEWGPNIYGAEAAARAYFSMPARDLAPAQAALLAGMLINPIRYTPLAPEGRLARRQRIILDRMVRFGRLSQQEYRIARGLAPIAPVATAASSDLAPVPAVMPAAMLDDELEEDAVVKPSVPSSPVAEPVEPSSDPVPELQPIDVPLAPGSG